MRHTLISTVLPGLFLAALGLLAAAPCQAQVSIGARAGVSLFNLIYSSTTVGRPELDRLTATAQPMRGFAPAVSVEVMLGERFAVQAELGYVLKGPVFDDASRRNETRLNCGEAALLAKALLGRGKIKVHLFGGPAWGHVFSIRSIIKDHGVTVQDSTTRKNDLGLYELDQWSVLMGEGSPSKRERSGSLPTTGTYMVPQAS